MANFKGYIINKVDIDLYLWNVNVQTSFYIVLILYLYMYCTQPTHCDIAMKLCSFDVIPSNWLDGYTSNMQLRWNKYA